jgi:glucokinase
MSEQFTIGIDIGGTNTSLGLVDRAGHVLARAKMSTVGHASLEAYIAGLAQSLAPLIEQAGKENIAGIGIGAPNGNYYTGEIIFAPNLPWTGVIPLATLVADATGIRAILTNDANAAAIGEMNYGAARGLNDFVVVTLGTGLGSGFVANGKLVYGHDGLAGELGHVIAERNGRRCNCGRLGCLERYASATGIVITAEEWLLHRNDETALRAIEGKLTAKAIQDAAHAGDALALELYDYTAQILGRVLADVVAITSPGAIIFFGGLANAGDMLLAPVKKYLEAELLNIYRNKVVILKSALPDADAAILGASALAW